MRCAECGCNLDETYEDYYGDGDDLCRRCLDIEILSKEFRKEAQDPDYGRPYRTDWDNI